MLFYSSRRKLYRRVRDSIYFYKGILKSFFVPVRSKKVFMEVENLALNRYLYNFIKFFQLCGYTVYLPKNIRIISSLTRKKGEFIYSSWILKEGVQIGEPKHPHLRLSKEILSNNYFSNFKESDIYLVPMSEYPGMYRYKIPVPDIKNVKSRKRSLFMSGNINHHFYDLITKSEIFSLPSRREMATFISQQPYYYDINSRIELHKYLNSGEDKKVILIDTSKKFRIPLNELKEVLVSFNFFLGMPGIWIPQSHNIIEAMSVGCIPVLHNEYANLFKPGLQHLKNAIIFESLEALDNNICAIFDFPETRIQEMQVNVLQYYNNFLSPEAVVEKIERRGFSKICIQAEEKSLALFQLTNE